MLAVFVFVASLAASVIANPVTGPIIKRDFPEDPSDIAAIIPASCQTICGYTIHAYNACQEGNNYICNMICSDYGEEQIDNCVACVTATNTVHPDFIQSGEQAVNDYCY